MPCVLTAIVCMPCVLMVVVCVLSLLSCGGRTGHDIAGGDTVAMKYAEHITMVRTDSFTLVTLADPWHEGRTLHTYVLVPQGQKVPTGMPEGTLVRTPLSRSLVSTSVHCALLQWLHREASVAGVCDLQYCRLPWLQEACRKGTVTDCGNSMSPTIEKVIGMHPDAILLSPFQNSGGYGRVSELGVPVIEMADYMETSPLGRAEWMKFYGLLFGAEKEADSLFRLVEHEYNQQKKLAKTSRVRRTVLMDLMTGSVWYTPGGKSTIGQMLADANAAYPWSDDKSSGSLDLPFERVLEKGIDADVWLFRYAGEPATRASLLAEEDGYSQLRAFRSGEMYGCNTMQTQFFEETPFRPDLLLRDLVIILHPDVRTLGGARYFVKVTR